MMNLPKLGSILLILGMAGCATLDDPVGVITHQIVTKKVSEPCRFPATAPPTEYVQDVQLTGNLATDALLIFRAMESELEERIAYEDVLEASLLACEGE